MRIESVQTDMVELPLPKPIGTAIHAISSVGCVVVTLRNNDGIEGQAHLFTINAERLEAFGQMVTGLADAHLVGKNPYYSEAIWHDIWSAINPTGMAGVTVSALSVLDIACWDLVGKSQDKPLYQLFGACRDRVDAYASSGLWLSDSIDELREEAARFLNDGFKALKIRVGSKNPIDDVTRVKAVRETIGDEIRLLADANQGLTPAAAIDLAKRLEEFSLFWLEEPVVTHDRTGLRRVRDASPIAIASGETEYSRFGAAQMLQAESVDVFMPDLQRIGGYSEFRKTAALCAAYHTKVSSHFFTELSLTMAGSIYSCDLVEHINWFAPLYNEEMVLQDGQLLIPNRAGSGFSYDPTALARYKI